MEILAKMLAMIVTAQLCAVAAAAAPRADTLCVSQEATPGQSESATLFVLALDRDRRPVTDLDESELKLYEGKKEQPIQSLGRSPATPVRIGFLIDASKSMAGSRRALRGVNDTELAGEVLHTGDLAFVATFTVGRSLVCPPTSDVREVAKGLRDAFAAQALGVTSVYDTIYWACGLMATTGAGRNVLIILSDMQDNQSEHTREEAIKQAQRSGTLIYPIVLGEPIPRAEGVARSFADETGGVYFTPTEVRAVRDAFRNIRTYLDNTYALQYRPRLPRFASIEIRCTRKRVKMVVSHRRY